jgi:aminoglycoside phosphotransferase (APT) family kinase protein
MVDIQVSLIRRLIATQFPQWAKLPISPVEPNGWDNKTFRLGTEMSVRLPSAERYSAQVEKEHRWLPRLAPFLPLPIPTPLAMGTPDHGYPWHWSVYRWLDGETAATGHIADPVQFAVALAQFLVALRGISPEGGPAAGPHNFFRGGDLSIYDPETRTSIDTLKGKIDAESAKAVWESALNSVWRGSGVWVHGDMSAGNLLVEDGRLCAVIDFGNAGVGDPACDLAIAWTLIYGESRNAFREAIQLDTATWARSRGWAIWKALLTLKECLNRNPSEATKAQHVIDEIVDDCFTV